MTAIILTIKLLQKCWENTCFSQILESLFESSLKKKEKKAESWIEVKE